MHVERFGAFGAAAWLQLKEGAQSWVGAALGWGPSWWRGGDGTAAHRCCCPPSSSSGALLPLPLPSFLLLSCSPFSSPALLPPPLLVSFRCVATASSSDVRAPLLHTPSLRKQKRHKRGRKAEEGQELQTRVVQIWWLLWFPGASS